MDAFADWSSVCRDVDRFWNLLWYRYQLGCLRPSTQLETYAGRTIHPRCAARVPDLLLPRISPLAHEEESLCRGLEVPRILEKK